MKSAHHRDVDLGKASGRSEPCWYQAKRASRDLPVPRQSQVRPQSDVHGSWPFVFDSGQFPLAAGRCHSEAHPHTTSAPRRLVEALLAQQGRHLQSPKVLKQAAHRGARIVAGRGNRMPAVASARIGQDGGRFRGADAGGLPCGRARKAADVWATGRQLSSLLLSCLSYRHSPPGRARFCNAHVSLTKVAERVRGASTGWCWGLVEEKVAIVRLWRGMRWVLGSLIVRCIVGVRLTSSCEEG